MIKHIFKLIWNKKKSNSLMILEILLSFLVLFFVLSYIFYNTGRANLPLGFETENRWRISLDNIDKLDSLEGATILTSLKQNLLAMDEVEAVTFTPSMSPFINSQWRDGTDLNGFPMHCMVMQVDLDMRDVLGLNVTAGRWFNEDDRNAVTKPVLVNQMFIDEYYNGQSMIDSTFLFDDPRHIVGVFEAYRYNGQFNEPLPMVMYLRHFTDNNDHVVALMADNVNANFEEELAMMVNTTTKTTGSVIENLEKVKVEDSRESWLLIYALLFICIFLCLNVALGLFGVLWYNINKRKSEIGLRQALGAHKMDIMKQFIFEIMVVTFIALIVGVFFAIQVPILKVTEFPDSLFYKSIVFSSIIILVLVLSCALLPSIQASKITPAVSLHED